MLLKIEIIIRENIIFLSEIKKSCLFYIKLRFLGNCLCVYFDHECKLSLETNIDFIENSKQMNLDKYEQAASIYVRVKYSYAFIRNFQFKKKETNSGFV